MPDGYTMSGRRLMGRQSAGASFLTGYARHGAARDMVCMAPDRKAVLKHVGVATNHQEKVEWDSHARFTATVERERFLLQRLTLHVEPEEKFIGAFLKPPLYSSAFREGFGTLYTAVYRPRKLEMEIRWPGTVWHLPLSAFDERTLAVQVPGF